MALTLNNGGVLRVSAVGRWHDTSEVRNVFQYRLESGGPLNAAQVLEDLEDIIAGILALVRLVQHVNMVWRGFTAETLDSNWVSGEVNFPSPIAGDVSGSDLLPPAVAALSYMQTGESRRQLRKYWPGLAEVDNTAGGLVSTAAVSALSSAGAALLGPATAPNGIWQYGHARPGVGASWVTPITFTTTRIPAYQRRRKQGRGI